MSQTYRLLENTLAMPSGAAIVPNERMMSGKLNVGLECKWPDDVDRGCRRRWIIEDLPTDISVATEYFNPQTGVVVKRSAEILLKPNLSLGLSANDFI